MNKYLLIFFIVLASCSSIKINNPQCLFPDQALERGGIIKTDFSESIVNLDIFKKSIICFEGSRKLVLSPLPYGINSSKYTKSGFEIEQKYFRESRLIIKDKKFNNLSKDDLVRIKKESNLLKSKLKEKYFKNKISFPFLKPTNGVLSSEYGVKRFINDQQRSPHLGIDIAAKTGTPVYAVADGKILLAKEFFYRGKNLLIGHGFNIKTSYSHLDGILVNEGDFVKKGKLIGYVGSSGRVTGPHLHFELIFLEEKLDPNIFIN